MAGCSVSELADCRYAHIFGAVLMEVRSNIESAWTVRWVQRYDDRSESTNVPPLLLVDANPNHTPPPAARPAGALL